MLLTFIRPESNYFEIEILDRGEPRFGEMHTISIGVVNLRFPLDTNIGRAIDSESIAYHTGEGTLYHGGPRAKPFGERCEIGDKIGILLLKLSLAFMTLNTTFTTFVDNIHKI